MEQKARAEDGPTYKEQVIAGMVMFSLDHVIEVTNLCDRWLPASGEDELLVHLVRSKHSSPVDPDAVPHFPVALPHETTEEADEKEETHSQERQDDGISYFVARCAHF
jgi:hypothetical protein